MCLDNLVRRASSLIPRATEADRIIHYENTVETVRPPSCRDDPFLLASLAEPPQYLSPQALPFSRMAIRRPKLFRVLYFGALGGALSVPWMVRDPSKLRIACLP